jgi:hypothetical protein
LRGTALGTEVLVLVTCTNRKTVPPASSLRLRVVPGRSIAARAAAWRERLENASGDPSPAETLYAGDHWQVVRSLKEVAKRRKVDVETAVCSAGYGLLLTAAPVHSYSATFSPDHPDSVTREVREGEASAARRRWWQELAAWAGPNPGSPRSIREFARKSTKAIFLAALSPPYLDAITEDLEEAIASTDPQRVAIFSAGTKSHPTLGQHLVPCDARLQTLLGGSRCSLNVRCLRYAIEQLPARNLVVTHLRRYFTRLLDRQPDLEAPKRTPLSDDEVAAFIRDALARDATARPTPLLKRLRDSGRACEQARFSALLRGVLKEGRRD